MRFVVGDTHGVCESFEWQTIDLIDCPIGLHAQQVSAEDVRAVVPGIGPVPEFSSLLRANV